MGLLFNSVLIGFARFKLIYKKIDRKINRIIILGVNINLFQQIHDEINHAPFCE